MIQLASDCLIFKTAAGESIPCSVAQVTIELMGQATTPVDPEVVQHAAEAVLHYFKQDLGRTSVSVAEFTEALERVLRSLGFKVRTSDHSEPLPSTVVSDLLQLAEAAGAGFELAFFQQVRQELRQQLVRVPRVLRFKNLRAGVKVLAGAKNWNGRCRQLRDQVVRFMRQCLSAEARSACQTMVVE